MTSPVRTERHDDVLVVISDNPPVNALGAAVRQGLKEGVEAGLADDSVKAIVIRCDGRTFHAGADITEFGKPPQGPSLPETLDAMEASAKPIVAAIHGTALGGGLEVALACHYRVAVPSAKLGLPEVNLGLLPGAGGTQRLPRVVGVEKALDMIVFGRPIGAGEAEKIGLVDTLAGEDSLEADAIAFAREKAKADSHPATSRRTDRLPDAAHIGQIFDDFKAKNGRKMRGFDAPAACMRCVRAAAELPYVEGVKVEREEFMKLMQGDQSKAQRHLFFAERQAAKIDDVPKDTPLIPIRKVGIIGAGTMGGGIAMNFLSAGIPVTMLEMKQEALDRGTGVMGKNYEGNVKRGRMSEEKAKAAMDLLSTTLDYADLADCDLVIEAVFESMDVKKDVFGKLDAHVKDGAILASNTSYLNVDEIAQATKRPGYVVGMHFFSPANVMKLLEVVRGAETRPDVLATVMALSKKIGKVAVVAGVCHGFIGNRMLSPRQREANKLIMEGATPWQIDKVHQEFGMPMGPFQMSDLAGLDIGWHRDTNRIESLRDELCAMDRRGQKTGAGFYDYDENRRGTPSDTVEALIRKWAEKEGTPQREISDEEIRERTLYPMVNEGALILEEGMAQRASDIDVVWIYGYGWPRYRGGPMFWADLEGADTILAGLEKHQDKMPDLKISQLLKDKAAKGETFN
ncbi:3-hydroxyacyl-CoA dehydrogenase NAD-binding domain-containing protein [Pacificimonas flava]|uniref:Enoyl-CoA hydratase n=1 Tax=Pacificimonas flava TaxID=1234595 RepID=M2TLZ0_9SPHN|nr:3-hydroxyacyl-CoA dehydrogenase NAD-binding domain-containing protein [Pacificimonas flava]EMD82751.1 Enoyl-CoA hydratase [Pacificimonas flava]MBB5279370.1 3-hydroxyacyl-CoA dehydrogenase [Pacificimonas flava]